MGASAGGPSDRNMVPLGISSPAAVRVGQALGRRDSHGASRAGWDVRGFWTGLCIALIPIGSTLLYAWRRKERGFAELIEYLSMSGGSQVEIFKVGL
ncbi:MAG TPA: hypothetical protein VFW94_13000 [Candidatus Acidoferrales bacterium]|nr:hypothetical protein [Candidatus Acidoferrales bacterium]